MTSHAKWKKLKRMSCYTLLGDNTNNMTIPVLRLKATIPNTSIATVVMRMNQLLLSQSTLAMWRSTRSARMHLIRFTAALSRRPRSWNPYCFPPSRIVTTARRKVLKRQRRRVPRVPPHYYYHHHQMLLILQLFQRRRKALCVILYWKWKKRWSMIPQNHSHTMSWSS